MKKIAILLLLCILLPLWGYATIVADFDTKEPVVSAVVFSANGSIVANSDINGNVAQLLSLDYPITVKCLGYKQKVCGSERHNIYGPGFS